MKILHVLSSFAVTFPGGITNYVRTLAASQASAGSEVDVLDGSSTFQWTMTEGGYRVRGSRATRIRAHVASTHNLHSESADLISVIKSNRYDLVHFHLTIGVGLSFYENFPEIGIAYVVSLHDYYLFCPRVTMMNWRGENCGGPERKKCERCVGVLDGVDLLYRASRKSGLPLPRLAKSSAVTTRNQAIEKFLLSARAVLAVSSRVAEFFLLAYPTVRAEVLHIGSSSALAPRATPTNRTGPIKVAAIGTLAEYKGAAILEALALSIGREDIEFQFWGRVHGRVWERRMERAGVQLCGAYSPDSLGSVLSDVDLGLVAPIWEDNAPQVVMEFLSYGVPVLGTRMGGIPDFVSGEWGYLFDPTPEGIALAADFLRDIDRTTLATMSLAIPQQTTPQAHANAVEQIYRRATTEK